MLLEGREEITVLSLLLHVGKHRHSIEEKVIQLQAGIGDKEAFISDYRPFILSTISSIRHRYITEQDDEFSIGLYAFHEAVQQYTYKKGSSFLSFARLLIKRDVIDYLRKELRSTFVSLDEVQETIDSKQSLSEYLQEMDSQNRREEILHFQSVLKDFKISFTDLVKESPKHQDTRNDVLEVAKLLMKDEELLEILFQKKKLPLKLLEQKTIKSRKTLERHRKYIIAMCLIFSNEYTYLKDYIGGGMKDE